MLSPAFISYAGQLRQLHAQIRAGQGDSAQADGVRDVMDHHWVAMSANERGLTRVLSADLYDIGYRGPEQAGPNQEQLQKLQRLQDATTGKEFEFLLSHLREVQSYLPPAFLFYIRARSWSALGDDDTANEFYSRAVALAPENGNYKSLALDTLAKSSEGRVEAEQRVVQILAAPADQPVELVAKAADLRFVATRQMDEAAANQAYLALLAVYDQLLPRLQGDADRRALIAQVLTTQGLCQEFLGQRNAALRTYAEALQVEPGNEAALVARGMLSYGESPQAIADLQAAIDVGTPLFWPFFFLAHYSARSGEFTDCVKFAEEALQRDPTQRAQADLYEWLAIANNALGAQTEAVERLFARAQRLAPDNDRLNANVRRFREWRAEVNRRYEWDYETDDSIREYGEQQRELALA
jgi:tetratricopeptide (TPR) repeat protein